MKTIKHQIEIKQNQADVFDLAQDCVYIETR